MAERFGDHLAPVALYSAPFLAWIFYLNSVSPISEYGFFGITVLMCAFVGMFGGTCYIAYMIYVRAQQHELQLRQADKECRQQADQEERKNKKLEAELSKEAVEQSRQIKKEEHEMKMSAAIELSKIKRSEQRAAIEFGSPSGLEQEEKYKVMDDINAKNHRNRTNISEQNNLNPD